MQVNLISITFLLIAFVFGTISLLIFYVEPHLPVAIRHIYRYGKFRDSTCHPLSMKTAVPKRWFKHFYVFAAPASSYVLYLVLYKNFWKGDTPKIVIWMLNMCLGKNRQPLVSPESTFLAVLIFTIHCCKRFYESHYINVLSGKMNIAYYIVGFYHYLGTLVSLIGESKGFIEGSESHFFSKNISYTHVVCACIALLSSYAQLRANYILSDLRKDKTGKTISTVYKIPYGGLFQFISGALQITEIMVYTSISVILWQASTYHCIATWVVVNQVCTAVLTHNWYIERFQSYPKSRKILVPYIF